MRNDDIEAPVKGGNHLLDSEYSPAVLAGLFDMSPSNIYQLQQRGIIAHSGSIRAAIIAYLNYWKTKATSKAGSINEIGAIRKSELDRVRTISGWYGIKKERGELVDKEEFVELARPIFAGLRSELIALARRHPSVRDDVDIILNGVAARGVEMLSDATQEIEQYVDSEIQVMDEMEEEAAEATPDHPNGDDGTELDGQALIDSL